MLAVSGWASGRRNAIELVAWSVRVSAALLLVIGQLLYTLGWSSRRVRHLCGDNAGPFVLDHCHIGLLSLLITFRASITTRNV